MKQIVLGLFCVLLTACGSLSVQRVSSMQTQRAKPYYLTTQANQVQDTCPGGDILKQYTCSDGVAEGLSCFDVYMVEGSPVPSQRYTLLQQTVQPQDVSAQPLCPANMKPDCASFLQALDYNLEFSWYLVNFPTSSFEQCRETYDCKRIDCYFNSADAAGASSTLVSCVFKKNQLFFVGSEITCQKLQP